MRTLLFLIGAAVVLVGVGAPAGADDLTDAAKKAYGFTTWPVKRGPLKPGLDLKSVKLEPWAVLTVRDLLDPNRCQRIVRYHAPPALELDVSSRPEEKVEIRLTAGGGPVWQQDRVTGFRAEKPGRCRVTEWAVSRRFLIDRKTLEIHVTE